jgi:hypothetical protein
MADDEEPATGDEAKPDLGDAGKKALEAERKARRDAEKAANDLKARLQELEDRDKSDGEKLAGRIAAAEKRADEAEARALRLEVAHSKGLTAAQARRLVGASKEELEADADDLLASFSPPKSDEPEEEPEGERPSPTNRPTPSLRGGGDPTQEPEPDIRSVVDAIPRGF